MAVPPASSTAAATAAPRPEAPPVTSTVPGVRSAGTREHLRDQTGGRAAGDVGDEDRAAAPLGERLALRKLGHRVVAALDPDVRAQRAEHGARVVLVEDDDRVDARQSAQHRGAVILADQRAL